MRKFSAQQRVQRELSFSLVMGCNNSVQDQTEKLSNEVLFFVTLSTLVPVFSSYSQFSLSHTAWFCALVSSSEVGTRQSDEVCVAILAS